MKVYKAMDKEELATMQLALKRMEFLSKMNGAIYFTNIGQAHCVEIAVTGQDPISTSTLGEAIDAAIQAHSQTVKEI